MINIMLGDKKLTELEEDLAGEFQEKCDMLDITYNQEADGDLFLHPALEGTTVVLYCLSSREAVRNLADSIKKGLQKHSALCIVNNRENSPRSLEILDVQIVICFNQQISRNDYSMKIFTCSQQQDRTCRLASRIIKKMISQGVDVKYTVATWWDRLVKVNYWPFCFRSSTPTLLLEFQSSRLVDEAHQELENAITSSIYELYKKEIPREESRALADIVEDICAEIYSSEPSADDKTEIESEHEQLEEVKAEKGYHSHSPVEEKEETEPEPVQENKIEEPLAEHMDYEPPLTPEQELSSEIEREDSEEESTAKEAITDSAQPQIAEQEKSGHCDAGAYPENKAQEESAAKKAAPQDEKQAAHSKEAKEKHSDKTSSSRKSRRRSKRKRCRSHSLTIPGGGPAYPFGHMPGYHQQLPYQSMYYRNSPHSNAVQKSTFRSNPGDAYPVSSTKRSGRQSETVSPQANEPESSCTHNNIATEAQNISPAPEDMLREHRIPREGDYNSKTH